MNRIARLTVVVEFPEDPEECADRACPFYWVDECLESGCNLPRIIGDDDEDITLNRRRGVFLRTARCKEVFGT